MGWRTIGGRRYYYRSKREGGRVRTEYVGAGEAAELFAILDADTRAVRAERRRAERAEREDRAVSAWFDRVEAIARAALTQAGYHRHHRGDWRKRRGRTARPQDPAHRSGTEGDRPEGGQGR